MDRNRCSFFPTTLRVQHNIKSSMKTLESFHTNLDALRESQILANRSNDPLQQTRRNATWLRNQHAPRRRLLHACQVLPVKRRLWVQLPSQGKLCSCAARIPGFRQRHSQAVVHGRRPRD